MLQTNHDKNNDQSIFLQKTLCLLIVITCLGVGFIQKVYALNQPNILLIISDDAGYHDFGFQGSKIMKTPALDKLASESIVFNQAYVTAAVCGPSRAGLYTGRYQQRFGFEENNVPGYMSKSGLYGNDMGLPLSETTMANYLKSAGYQTGLFGKWHMGDDDRFHPLKRGFDKFYGFRTGSRSYFSYNKEELKQRKNERIERGFKSFEEHKGYLTDVLATETNRFIERSVADSTPFFGVLSFTAVHAPMEAKKEDLAKFPYLTGKRKTLAAMNLSMDHAIEKILNKLDSLAISQNTLVIFVNDNGGPTDQNHSNNYPLSGTKANHLEGGIRVPMLMRWPKKLNAGIYHYPVSTLDILPTLINVSGKSITPYKELDGVNLLPYLTKQKNTRPHQTLYWKKENRAAIRDGDFKLLRFPDRPAELYNLKADIAESQNIAGENPEILKHLYKKLFNWELTLERPLWQLKREYEGIAMKRMDNFRTHKKD